MRRKTRPLARLADSKWRLTFGLSAALSLVAGAAQAAGDPQGADVIDWAPPDAEGALVLRHADAVKLGLQFLNARFGDTRALNGVVPRLLAYEHGGAHPFAGDWGPGIDLGRGLAFFGKDKAQSLRCVVGSTDAAKARATLAALLSTEEVPVSVEGEHLKTATLDFTCAQRGPWLVCDTGAVPEQAPGRTDWLSADTWLEVAVRGAPMRELAEDLPLTGFHLEAGPTALGGHLAVRVDVAPAAQPMLANLLPGDGPVGGADCLDQRSGFVGRLSMDAARLFKDHSAAFEPGIPPEGRPLWDALKTGFTGDILVSAAGGFTHPLLTLGVRDAAAAEAIVKGLGTIIQAGGAQLTLSPGTLSIGIPDGDKGTTYHVNVRYGARANTLVFGLAERDVARCVNGEVRAAPLPAALAAKGANGFITWMLPSGGLPPGLFTGDGSTQIIEDVSSVAGAMLRLIDELGVRVAPGKTTIDTEIWWTTL